MKNATGHTGTYVRSSDRRRVGMSCTLSGTRGPTGTKVGIADLPSERQDWRRLCGIQQLGYYTQGGAGALQRVEAAASGVFFWAGHPA